MATVVRERLSSAAQLRGLFHAGARATWNSWWHSGSGRRLVLLAALPTGLLVWASLLPLVQHLGRGVQLDHPRQLLGALSTLTIVLTAFTLGTSVSFALASVYFARDVEWLLLTPISSRLFLVHRLLSQLILGICLGALLGGPMVLGLALLYHSLWSVPLVAVDLTVLLLMPMALALLLVVLLVRVVPASRVKDAAALLVGLVGFGVAAVNIAAAVTGGRGPGLGAAAFAHGLSGPGWLPTAWAAHSMVDAVQGRWLAALLLSLGLAASALLVTTGAVLVAAPALREGWFRSQTAPARRRRHRGRFSRLPPLMAVVRKDWRTLRRDPAQLIQLLLPIGLFAVYLLSPRSAGMGVGMFSNFPVWYGPLTTAAFAALFAASGLGLRAVGSEGRHFWCLRTSPLSPRSLLLGKLVLPALISVGASLTLMVTTEIRVATPLPQIAFSAILLVLCVLGLVSLATGMGAAWPRLEWTDPRRAVGIWLAVTFMAAGAAYIALCLVGLTLPLLMTNLPPLLSDAMAVAVCAVCAGVTAGFALRAGHHRLVSLDT
ncbi:MAG: putative ABC transporter permease subunit [Candidatus Dormibacteria bacterium]